MAFARIKPRPSAIATEAPKAISPSPFIRGSSPFELPRIPLLAFAAEKSSIARVLRAEKTSSRKRRCDRASFEDFQNSHDRTFLHTEERFLVLGIPAATSCTHMRARSFVEPNRSSKTRAASSLPDIFLGRAADSEQKPAARRGFLPGRLMAQGNFPLTNPTALGYYALWGYRPNSRTDNVCKSRTSGARFISRCVREGRLQAFVQRADDMKDTSSFLDLALDDSMGFDPLGAFDNDVDDDAEEVTEGYLGTPHTDDPTPVVDTRPGVRAHRRPVQRHGAAPSHAARHDRLLRRAADHRRPGCRGGSPAGGQLLRVLPRFARELARARRSPRPRDRRRRAVPRGRPGAGARGSRRRVLLRGRRGAGGLLACH